MVMTAIIRCSHSTNRPEFIKILHHYFFWMVIKILVAHLKNYSVQTELFL